MGPLVSNSFAQHGVRFHIRGGPVEVLDCSYKGWRPVVFEFPSIGVTRFVWNSPEYADVTKLREGSGKPEVWAVGGI